MAKDTKKAEQVQEAPKMVQLSSGHWAFEHETMVITCEDCGAERRIKVQDGFQVKRCIPCQKASQRSRRNEKMKAKNAAKSEAKRQAELKTLIMSLSDEEIARFKAE